MQQLSKVMRIRTIVFTFIFSLSFLSVSTSPLLLQAQTRLTPEQRSAVVEKISQLVIENYVFEEVGKESAAFIQSQLESGRYADISDPEAFSNQLTDDLQSITHDKHMRVRVRPQRMASQESGDPETARAHRLRQQRAENFGFEKVERLAGNVGYLDMRYFAGGELPKETAAAAMKFLANTDAIIFDMRKNGGGNPEMIQYICSYLFGEKTHLNSLYWRRGDRTDEFWTLDEIDGKRRPDVPVFVLTSTYSFSGAEEFTYNLQTRNRATIVGETTGGGANPGGTRLIDDTFLIFIPTGRAINPITGTNWEGVGVKPDIDVPADSAFSVALRMAQKAAETYREKEIAEASERRETRRARLNKAKGLIAAGQAETAEKLVNQALQHAVETGDLDEVLINMLGYRYMESSPDLAVTILKFNASVYPESPNVYDSLGDAYKAKNELDLARQNFEIAYKKGLENDDPNVEIFKRNLEEVKRLIAETN